MSDFLPRGTVTQLARLGQALREVAPSQHDGTGHWPSCWEGADHWIWTLAAEHFGERTEIVDFSHATEHVWMLAHALFGEGTFFAHRWADFAILALAEEGDPALLTLLDATQAPSPLAAAILQRERHYVRTVDRLSTRRIPRSTQHTV